MKKLSGATRGLTSGMVLAIVRESSAIDDPLERSRAVDRVLGAIQLEVLGADGPHELAGALDRHAVLLMGNGDQVAARMTAAAARALTPDP
jgi:hypothetical protein